MITNVDIKPNGFQIDLANGEKYSCTFCIEQNCSEFWYLRNDPVEILKNKYICGIKLTAEVDPQESFCSGDRGTAGRVLTLTLSDKPCRSITEYPKLDMAKIDASAIIEANDPHRRYAIYRARHEATMSHYANVVLGDPMVEQMNPGDRRVLSRRAYKNKVVRVQNRAPLTWSFRIGNNHNGYYPHSFRFVLGNSKMHTIEGSI